GGSSPGATWSTSRCFRSSRRRKPSSASRRVCSPAPAPAASERRGAQRIGPQRETRGAARPTSRRIGPLDRGWLASARAHDFPRVPGGPLERALPLRGCGRLGVNGGAGLGASAVCPATFLGRRAGGDATALADAPLVEHFHARPCQRLPQNPVEVPLVML